MTAGGTIEDLCLLLPGSSVSKGVEEDRNSGDKESESVAMRNR